MCILPQLMYLLMYLLPFVTTFPIHHSVEEGMKVLVVSNAIIIKDGCIHSSVSSLDPDELTHTVTIKRANFIMTGRSSINK